MDGQDRNDGLQLLVSCILQKSLKNLSWFAPPAEIHFTSSSWCSRSILGAKAFNHNFSKVLTKREQNHRHVDIQPI